MKCSLRHLPRKCLQKGAVRRRSEIDSPVSEDVSRALTVSWAGKFEPAVRKYPNKRQAGARWRGSPPRAILLVHSPSGRVVTSALVPPASGRGLLISAHVSG